MKSDFYNLPLRDKDQDDYQARHCALEKKGGGWFYGCQTAHLTGYLTTSRQNKVEQELIEWANGGERGYTRDSWKEAKMILIPK